MNKADDYKELLENILKASIVLYDMKDSPNFRRKKLFIEIVEQIMALDNKTKELYKTTGINLLEWENDYFKVIENLLELCFGPTIAEVISIYIYAEPDEEEMKIAYNTPDGSEVKVETIEDLYDYVMQLVDWEIQNEADSAES